MCVICEKKENIARILMIRCDVLEDIPDYLTNNVEALYIKCCPNLRTISPSLKSLERLEIYNCPLLTRIPSLPIVTLAIVDCPLVELSTQDYLKVLHCTNCATIKLPELPCITYLKLNRCPNVGKIPSIRTDNQIIPVLDITYCDLITDVSHLDKRVLFCAKNCMFFEMVWDDDYIFFRRKDKELDLVLKLQKWVRDKYIPAKKIKKLADSEEFIKLWWDPEAHGGYFHKKISKACW